MTRRRESRAPRVTPPRGSDVTAIESQGDGCVGHGRSGQRLGHDSAVTQQRVDKRLWAWGGGEGGIRAGWYGGERTRRVREAHSASARSVYAQGACQKVVS